ncbi:YkyA family protein [Neobacillus novalis]|uniref:YkyA family protein n=1 Tax=Neobacillus novalis TaxID=220687 RepID=A0AA95SCH8_9BACI|nr:YkyA family protein [Neobacillus novalis]WHY87927.1 YkyA family protein [Neobacillus novalis]
MSCKNKGRYLYFMIAICLILSGCVNKTTPVEKMYDVLEKVVSKEKVFEEQQDPLVTLEKEEKQKYDQIIGLGMKEYDQIVKLSDEAIALTDKRKEHMEKETDSLKESEQEFKKVADIKDELDNPELKKLTNELYDIMMQRYRTHEELYREYTEVLKSDKELYGMFKNKNLAMEDLEAQVTKLNETYKKVLEVNENFNKLTEQYNDKKLLFYKKAGLKLNK